MIIRSSLAVLALSAAVVALPSSPAAAASVWPAAGQAAYGFGLTGEVHQSGRVRRAPIASMSKVMTAYLVLRARPLTSSSNGFTMTVSQGDVDDYRRRVARGESTVRVVRGEHITERQALAALLLPSANNIAIMLARRIAGTVSGFLARMNSTAAALHMTHTTYTDPSGFASSTTSTPADQLALARTAIRVVELRLMVARTSYWVPVVGWVRNTDTLLGRDGFRGVKTGSMSAAGGCFMFRSRRVVNGRIVELIGVVMGQPGRDLVQAGLSAAKRLVDAVAPVAAAP